MSKFSFMFMFMSNITIDSDQIDQINEPDDRLSMLEIVLDSYIATTDWRNGKIQFYYYHYCYYFHVSKWKQWKSNTANLK